MSSPPSTPITFAVDPLGARLDQQRHRAGDVAGLGQAMMGLRPSARFPYSFPVGNLASGRRLGDARTDRVRR
jgi:hypothetical protein